MLPKAFLLGIPTVYLTSFGWKHVSELKKGSEVNRAISMGHVQGYAAMQAFSIGLCSNRLIDVSFGKHLMYKNGASLACVTVVQTLIAQTFIHWWIT